MPIKLEALAPAEALLWFKARGVAPTFDWRDLWRASAENAFAIAGVTSLEVLGDMKDALGHAIETGMPFEEFRANARNILAYHGWLDDTAITDPITGRTRVVNIATSPRLQNIWRTNIGQAFNAGRAEHISYVASQRIARGEGMTYLRFQSVGGTRTCQTCESLDGLTRPYNDEAWSYCTPLIHSNCRCITYSLSADELDDFGYHESPKPKLDIKTFTNERTGHQVRALQQPGFGGHDWQKHVREQYAAFRSTVTPDARRALDSRWRSFQAKHGRAN